MRALAVVLFAALLAAGAGYGVGRMGWRRVGLGCILLLLAATVATVISARQSPGMEGLARFILALLIWAPGTAGFSVGLWLGLRGGAS